MEINHEDYVNIAQAAKKLNMDRKNITYIIARDEFKDKVIIIKSKTLIPISLLKNVHDFYFVNSNLYKKYKESHDYVPSHLMVRYLDISFEELLNQVEFGVWDGKFIKLPKVTPPTREEQNHYNYFFIRSLTVQNYKTITAIAKRTKIVTRETLMSYAKKGLLPQPEHLKGSNLFDEAEVIKLLPRLRDSQLLSRTEKIRNSKVTSYSLLNVKQQMAIDEYLEYRKKGGKINFNGFRSKQKIANPDRTLKVMKEIISSAFVLIISGRCRLEEEVIKNQKLQEHLLEKFNPDAFEFLLVSIHDFFSISSQREERTLTSYLQQLRPFYYYHLQMLKSRAIVNEKKHREFLSLENSIDDFLDQFPRFSDEWYVIDESKATKSFLTPEQMIIVKHLILSDPVSKDPIKNATMWQLGCSTAVRPEEMQNIRIEYFDLDISGFLKLNDRGWGCLRIPAKDTKQERSPSHPIYGTIIPVDTVKQINEYLGQLYQKQGPLNPKGKGYLFRPNYANPDLQYTSIDKDFIVRIRPFLTFLNEDQRDNFVLKSSRHSMNNFISNTFLHVEHLNGQKQKWAAQYQMRHKPEGTTGDKFYSDLLSKDDFYQALELTINFPWELEKLEQWEIKYGYKKFSIDSGGLEEELLDSQINPHYTEHMVKIEQRLADLKVRPKSMSVMQWTSEVHKLKKQRTAMSSQNIKVM
jgi:integrase